jgi:hypothetical protein
METVMNDPNKQFLNNPCFKFEKNRLKLAELPDGAMQYFDPYCANIQDKLDAFIEKINADLEELNLEPMKASVYCLETLGAFLPPQPPSSNANIFLCPERILLATKAYQQNDDCTQIYDFFYSAIKMHEYAHASMSPQLNDLSDKSNPPDDFYKFIEKRLAVAFRTFIEESLATVAMLIEMKDHPLYAQLVLFVSSQPLQYQYGIVLMQKFAEVEITCLMCIWKNAKSTVLWNSALNSFMECLTGEDTVTAIEALERIDAVILSIRNVSIPDIVLLKLNPADTKDTKKFQAMVCLYRD